LENAFYSRTVDSLIQIDSRQYLKRRITNKNNAIKVNSKRHLANGGKKRLKQSFYLLNQTVMELNFRFMRTVTRVPAGFFLSSYRSKNSIGVTKLSSLKSINLFLVISMPFD
jgi:hypothetical protein